MSRLGQRRGYQIPGNYMGLWEYILMLINTLSAVLERSEAQFLDIRPRFEFFS